MSALFRSTALLLPAALLTGCADGPASPAPPAHALALVTGSEQQGLTGEPLLWPITLKVTGADGEPVQGVTPVIEVATGAAAATASSAAGNVQVIWILGAEPGEQILRAHLPGGAWATVRAQAIPPELSDVVLLPAGVSRTGGAVLVNRSRNQLSSMWSAIGNEGRIVLPPLKDVTRDLVIFPADAPPLVWAGEWTWAADTVHVPAREPVGVDMTVVLHEPPLEALRKTAEAHLKSLNEIFRAAGLTLGDIEIREAPAPGTSFAAATFCSQEPANRIMVHYVALVQGSPYGGYACANRIAMGARTGSFSGLLAHELGHLLGLGHTSVTDNVMYPAAPGSRLTEGQIFIAHFASYSVLNSVLDVTPPELRRDCRSTDLLSAGCFAESFRLSF